MRTSTLRFTAAVFAILSLAATSAMAGSILVNNNNFSTLPTNGLNHANSAGPYSESVGIPGWTATGATGQWAPSGVVLGLPAGATAVAYSNGPTISQTVSPTVVAGDTYTLTVDIGDRKGITPFPGGADLSIGGVAYDATGTPLAGGWSVYTATFTGDAADAGDAITIQLTDHGTQTDFSDVTLSFTDPPPAPTPEPGTLSLAGLGLLCAMGYGLRKSVA
ncbi:MAG: DUF642 domain-containing protein [Terracidiphilus sp.]|jgi:hypothetical protein